MNPKREEVLFEMVLAKPADQRAAFLEVICENEIEAAEAREKQLNARK